MATKRSPRPRRSSPRAPAGWRKVTLDLPRGLAKRLKMLAVERETTLGRLVAPAVESLLAGSYFVDRAGANLAIAEGSAELAGEAKAG
jgi:hypothetical protein